MKKAFLICSVLLVASFSYAAENNLVLLHKNAGKASTKECLTCHQVIMKESTRNKKAKTFHKLHLESKLETPKECAGCHKSVDLREGSAATLRKQVSSKICVECHEGGIKGAKKLFE